MRILVTGSRDWTDPYSVARALSHVVPEGTEMDAVIVHGDCPTGADRMAREWAETFGVHHEPHPADWSLGKKAGPLRNQSMVDLGADVCLAFPSGESRGTRDCMRRAAEAGIPVVLG